MPQNKFIMTRFYILLSCFFWIITSFFFFLKWHDPTVVVGKIAIWMAFFAVLFLSCAIGFILSLPVLYLRLFFSSKIIPIFFLIFIHFSFLILNLGVEPEFLKNALQDNSFVFKLSSFVHEKIFKVNLVKFDADWTAAGKRSVKNSEYIFLFNEGLLDKIKSYPISKSLLKEDIFLISNEIRNDKQVDEIDAPFFLNQFAASQPQFMLFYRLGFAGIFQKSLQWKNVDQTNFSLLNAAVKALMSHQLGERKHVLFLSKFDQKDDIYLSRAIKILLNQNESRILILPRLAHSHDFEIVKAYSNWIGNDHVFFYEDVFKKDLHENKNMDIDCRLEDKAVSRFICIFEGKKMYAFVKKINPSRKEFRKVYQKSIFSQLFSVDQKTLKKKLPDVELENNEFFNQFDIYAFDPLDQKRVILLLPSERGRFIKGNGKKILDIFNNIYH